MSETVPKDIIEQAKQLHHSGRLADAAALYKQVVENDLENIDALYGWSCVAFDRGNFDNAARLLDRLLHIQNDHAPALTQRGRVLLQQGKPYPARKSFEQAIESDQSYIPAYSALSALLVQQFNDPWKAESIARQGLAIEDTNGFLHQVLAMALHTQGQSDEAIDHYKTDLKLRSEYRAEILCNLASVAVDQGDKNAAEEYFSQAIEHRPDLIEAHRRYASVHKFTDNDPHIGQLQSVLSMQAPQSDEAAQIHFALGKAYDDLNKFGQAFEHFAKGNAIIHAILDYDMDIKARNFAAIKTAYSKRSLDRKLPEPAITTTPIFVLGMPRSGTSLIEQILFAHPKVGAAGEALYLDHVQALHGLSDCAPYNGEPAKIPDDILIMARDEYLQKLKRHEPDAEFIADKMPANFSFVGLIRLLFPQAKIIHCKRDPMDTCFSIFKQYFTDPVAYAYDLDALARFYNLYDDLMAFWHERFPGFIFDVHYEDVVENPESVTRGMLEYCGLPWDRACLEFYKSKRPVMTASAMQVRKPIYKGAVGSWKKYEKQLQPLKDALASLSPARGQVDK